MSVVKFHQNQSKDSACWRLYGTWSGQPSCEKLKFVTHCRNCDVFENAARQTMERRNSQAKSGLTVFSIEELIEKEKSSGDCSALPFRVGAHCFAVPSSSIETITDNVAVHSIPYNSNPILKGLVAINNEIYTLVNIPHLLGVAAEGMSTSTNSKKGLYKRVVVVNLGEHCIAFYVDEVYQIHRYFQKFVQQVEEDAPVIEIAAGMLDNYGSWETDCILLDLPALESHFEKNIR